MKPLGELRMPGDGEWKRAFPAAVAGRVEPLFVVADDDHVKAVSLSGAALFEGEAPHPLASPVWIDFVEDLMGDSSEEVVVNWSVGSDAAISVLNQNLLEVRRFTTRGQVEEDSLGVVCVSSLRAARVVDLDWDGRRELIAGIDNRWGEEVFRGAVCFDFETSEEKWIHKTGAYLRDFRPVDLDADGVPEILWPGKEMLIMSYRP